MNAAEANTLVRELFASRTRTPTADQTEHYVRMVLDASDECAGCIRETMGRLCRSGPAGVPTEPQIWETFRGWMNGSSHLNHVNRSETEDLVSRAEGFWRGRAVQAIEAAAGVEPLRAQYIASLIWASEVVPMDLDVIRAECVDGPWLKTAPPRISADLVRFSWDYARLVATRPLIDWPQDEWDSWCARWTTILNEHRDNMNPVG